MDSAAFSGKLRKILVADGALGTELLKQGFTGCPEGLNLSRPEIIGNIHRSYAQAGADIIIANTFGANRLKLREYGLQGSVKVINQTAVKIARESCTGKIIAGELGPLGGYLEPLGNISFDDAYSAYSEQVTALKAADVIIISTIADIRVLKAAIIAAKEAGKAVIASMTFEDGRTVTGTDPLTFATVAAALGADVVGCNCSAGPAELLKIIRAVSQATHLPLSCQPNAGLPKFRNGRTHYDAKPRQFRDFAHECARIGVSIIGGCCGTDPSYISEIAKAVGGRAVPRRAVRPAMRLCSRTRTVEISGPTIVVGERINPTNKPDLQKELRRKKTSAVRRLALEQVKQGAALLDVNLGVPGTDETALFRKVLPELQNAVDVPLVIDTCDIKALEAALKLSDGRPLINSVNGSQKSMAGVLPLARRYGAATIALTFDEAGIPKTGQQRIRIAELIIETAAAHGLGAGDIAIDFLAMTLATDEKIDRTLVSCVKQARARGYNTILGISNISHGLPNRPEINSKFLSQVSRAGLSMAILNPVDNIMFEDDEIQFLNEAAEHDYTKLPIREQLRECIIYGDKAIVKLIGKALKEIQPLKINDILVKAMEEVGRKFKSGEYFLPQVLLSAKAMSLAFARLRKVIRKEGGMPRGRILIATVENDIHDIGKNIVAALLESYNYEVIDLGKSVPTKRIVDESVRLKPDIVALSALMTTTIGEMQNVVKSLKSRGIAVKILVGGAVVNRQYAADINAIYASDALDAAAKLDKMLKNEKNH
ncbi:MAG: homocysteine S-methyltransferase family protein [archaeon]